MTASEARDAAHHYNTSASNKAIVAANNAIDTAAAKGAYSAFTYERLTDDAKADLLSRGFKLREWDDQRDGYGCEISWK